MKILFTGTFRSGKSTLLNELHTKYPHIGFVPEVARELLSQDPTLEQKPEFQDILFFEQVRRERAALLQSPVIMCDRGALDIITYASYFGQSIKPEWQNWARSYTKVYLFNKDDVPFTPEITAADPQYAPGRDWQAFRNGLDAAFRETCQTLHIPFKVLEGSVQQRSEVVSDFLALHSLEGQRRRIEFL